MKLVLKYGVKIPTTRLTGADFDFLASNFNIFFRIIRYLRIFPYLAQNHQFWSPTWWWSHLVIIGIGNFRGCPLKLGLPFLEQLAFFCLPSSSFPELKRSNNPEFPIWCNDAFSWKQEESVSVFHVLYGRGGCCCTAQRTAKYANYWGPTSVCFRKQKRPWKVPAVSSTRWYTRLKTSSI